MKQIKLIAWLCFLASCAEKVVTEYKDVIPLRASLVYNWDSVIAYKQKVGDNNGSIATSYLERAKKEETHNPEHALYLYKRSVTLNPSLESYVSLAKLLSKLNRNEERNDLYRFLAFPRRVNEDKTDTNPKYLFGPVSEDIFYEYLISMVLRYHVLYAEDMYGAKESGYDLNHLKTRLIADERIKMDTTSLEFKTMLLQFLPYDQLQAAALQPAMFAGFLSSIKDTSLVFEIGLNTVPQFNYEKFNGVGDDDFMQINFDGVYAYYLAEKQEKKDNWIRFNFNHHLKLSGSFNTVIYAVDTSEIACPLEMRHVYHRLATYDGSGNILDSKVIASQAGEELTICRIDHNQFNIARYKRVWKKPYQKTDFDNDLISTNPLSESTYVISADGLIHETEATGLRP